MGIKGLHSCKHIQRSGTPDHPSQQSLVTTVDAIKGADGQYNIALKISSGGFRDDSHHTSIIAHPQVSVNRAIPIVQGWLPNEAVL